MTEYSVYVGSVFHKDTLAVAVAVASYCQIWCMPMKSSGNLV